MGVRTKNSRGRKAKYYIYFLDEPYVVQWHHLPQMIAKHLYANTNAIISSHTHPGVPETEGESCPLALLTRGKYTGTILKFHGDSNEVKRLLCSIAKVSVVSLPFSAVIPASYSTSRQRGAVVRSVVFTTTMIARLMVQLPT